MSNKKSAKKSGKINKVELKKFLAKNADNLNPNHEADFRALLHKACTTRVP
jgi:hypothetical protein